MRYCKNASSEGCCCCSICNGIDRDVVVAVFNMCRCIAAAMLDEVEENRPKYVCRGGLEEEEEEGINNAHSPVE